MRECLNYSHEDEIFCRAVVNASSCDSTLQLLLKPNSLWNESCIKLLGALVACVGLMLNTHSLCRFRVAHLILYTMKVFFSQYSKQFPTRQERFSESVIAVIFQGFVPTTIILKFMEWFAIVNILQQHFLYHRI